MEIARRFIRLLIIPGESRSDRDKQIDARHGNRGIILARVNRREMHSKALGLEVCLGRLCCEYEECQIEKMASLRGRRKAIRVRYPLK